MTRTEMKKCPKCGEEKPRTKDFFTIRKSRVDSWCKDCMRISHHKYYQENKDKIREKSKQKYKARIEQERDYARNLYYKYREKKIRQREEKINKKISLGICTRCKEKSLPNLSMCEKHYLWNIAYSNLGDGNRWVELKHILQRQNYRDPYTGEQLLVGVNAQLDHIYPRKRYPELANEISNFQFLTTDMNRLKNNFTNDELFSYCLKIIDSLKNKGVA